MITKKNIKGFSLIEILIVITIFAVIGLLTTRSIFLTIRGAKKSDSLVRVRENLNYSLAVIERQLRSAESITLCGSSGSSTINYVSLEGTSASFTCFAPVGVNTGYIASASAGISGRLTSSEVSVTTCSFTCSQTDINNPPVVKVVVEAVDTESTSAEKGTVSAQTEIVVRNY